MFKDRRIKAATISIIVNLVMVAIQFYGAWLSKSQGMRADAFHSFSDIGVSSLVLISILATFKLKKWGKGIEDGIAVFIGIIIGWVGISVLRSSGTVADAAPLQNVPTAIVLTWICILIAYFVSRYKLRVGEECDAASLRADGHHSRMDMYSSIAVMIGLLGNWSGLNLDAVASVIVGLMILRLSLVVLAAAAQNALRPDGHIADAVGQLEGNGNWVALFATVLGRIGMDPEVVQQSVQRAVAFLKGKKRMACAALIVLLPAWYAASGLYVIGADELGVLTRFGRLQDAAVQPGLHYRLPAPFSTLHRAKPGRVFQLEFGFRTVGTRGVSTEPQAYLWENRHLSGLYEKKLEESILLTGDKNEVDLNFTIEYRLMPEALARYYFNTAAPETIIRALAQQNIQNIAGTMELTDVLTTGRTQVEKQIIAALQPMLDMLEVGVEITAARLQDVHPPAKVVSAFRSVAAAREERATIIHQAEAYRNETLPDARGGAFVLQDDAAAYVAEKRLQAKGEASQFTALAAVHLAHPEAVKFLWYVATLEKSLQDSRIVLFDKEITQGEGGRQIPDYFLGTEFFKRGVDRAAGGNEQKSRAKRLADEIKMDLSE